MSEESIVKDPIWKHAVEEMMKVGLTYGTTFQTAQLAEWLRCAAESTTFAFAMISVRNYLLLEEGYYLRCTENGALWVIPPAFEHNDVGRKFDRKVLNNGFKSILVREKTLNNPAAALDAQQRQTIEREAEHAANRMVLLMRQKPVGWLPPKASI